MNDKLITIGFAQINNMNTHRGIHEETNIDHIWINCPRRVVNHEIIQNLNSDHDVLLAQIRGKDLNLIEERRRVRNWRGYSKEKFLIELKNQDWSKLYDTGDINKVVEEFTRILTLVMDKIAPIMNLNNRLRFQKYITSSTKQLRNQRNSAWDVWKRSNNGQDWDSYKVLRHKYAAALKQDKKNYEKDFTKEIMEKDTGKELWRIIYQRAGWVKSLSPSIINDEGTILKKKIENANTINNYYRIRLST